MNCSKKELFGVVYALGAGEGKCLLTMYAAKYSDRKHPQVKYSEILNQFCRTMQNESTEIERFLRSIHYVH